jgi:hypothetical protein
MRKFYFLILTFNLFACSVKEQKEQPKDQDNLKYQFYENGGVSVKAEFLDGKRHGLVTNYFEDGEVLSLVNYQFGRKHGESIIYYYNGNPKIKLTYKNDKREGKASYYYENGSLFRTSVFQNDIFHGLRTTYYKNKVISEVNYENGIPQEGLKEYDLMGNELPLDFQLKYEIIDLRKDSSAYVVNVFFEKSDEDDQFYLVNTSGEYNEVKPTKGKASLKDYAHPSENILLDLEIHAIHKTSSGNPFVVRKKIVEQLRSL